MVFGFLGDGSFSGLPSLRFALGELALRFQVVLWDADWCALAPRGAVFVLGFADERTFQVQMVVVLFGVVRTCVTSAGENLRIGI